MRAPATGWRRRVAVAAVALAAACAAAPVAAAHVGQPTTVLTVGPYRLAIRAAPVPVPPHAPSALGFHAKISARATGTAVARTSVSLAVATGTGRRLGVYALPGFDGYYSQNVPIPGANGWRSLRLTLRIAGPLGVSSVRYVPPDLFAEWPFEPLPVALAALAALLFLQGFVRLRRRGRTDHASYGRLVLFALGLCLMVLPLVSPLDPVADAYLLSGHMLEHVLLGDAGPALLMVALRGPLLFFFLPPALLRVLGRADWLRRAGAWLIRPRVVLCAWALAYGCWHIPSAYDYAAAHAWAHDLEHTSFALAGILLWNLLVDPAGHGGLSRGRRLAVAAGVFAMGTAISDVLIFSLHPLYPLYATQPERLFGLTPVHDQELAGIVMMVEQILTLGTFAAVLLVPVLRTRTRRSRSIAGQERLA